MNQIRITGGHLRGKSINAAEGHDARYTASMVREAIFNTIGDVTGKRILDLFAGIGSFTVESLSRGALSATCVENDRTRVGILRSNLDTLSLNRYCDVLDMDVIYAVPFLSSRGNLYDIIFMDPPYGKGLLTETMRLLEKHVIYSKETIVIMEHSKREKFSDSEFSSFHIWKTRNYGDTSITMLLMSIS
ncbi:MAG TPA: 16S rRNA (guanine(966)-N(2))-methyltransferase RsmD [Syntrophorhabdaceae bacterium]|nr:16S rRNA (guanine(966)-N(2))-methyltransferase RsmD [Syntrophorhabdaceae bacterium]